MRALADALGISPTTLYTTLRLAVQALMGVRCGKVSVTALADRVRTLEARWVQVESAYWAAQAEVACLKEALTISQTLIETL